jgi:hypothetical protein
MQKIKGYLEKKADRILFIASTEQVDRHGESIPIDTWDLKNFKKSPKLFVDHDAKVENIVGKAKKVWIEGKQLLFEPVFHGITELSRTVEKMVNEGILDTVSVGFMEKMAKNGDIDRELLEISFVGIPANVGAHRLKSIDEKKIRQFVGEETLDDTVSILKQEIKKLDEEIRAVKSEVGSLAHGHGREVRRIKLINARKSTKRADAIISQLNASLRNSLYREERS